MSLARTLRSLASASPFGRASAETPSSSAVRAYYDPRFEVIVVPRTAELERRRRGSRVSGLKFHRVRKPQVDVGMSRVKSGDLLGRRLDAQIGDVRRLELSVQRRRLRRRILGSARAAGKKKQAQEGAQEAA